MTTLSKVPVATGAQSAPQSSSIIATGFALFSMFFGAGNLIFPMIIGKMTGENWLFAIFGLSISAIIVPFLGLIGMILFQANLRLFLDRLGTYPGFFLLLLLQLILGPVGVIPRLMTLMHAIMKGYLFDISLPLFSVFVAGIVYLCSFKRKNLIGILGVVLTPILLLSLISLFSSGLWTQGAPAPSSLSEIGSFVEGFVGGYNTMDLIAALMFATIILPHFKQEVLQANNQDREGALYRKLLLSSSLAASLLFLTYIGISFISAYHAPIGANYPPAELLSIIATKLLGPFGGFIAAITIVTACLTTTITLTLIFAQYLHKDLSHSKFSPNKSLIATLLIATAFANIGFDGILSILGPILEVCYPGLIALTVFNILHHFKITSIVKTPVFLTFGISLLFFIKKFF